MGRIIWIGAMTALLALLAACGSAPSSDTTGGQSSTSATTAASAATTATQPTTTAPEATAMSAKPTKASTEQSTDLIASLMRSGGIAGRTQTLLVRQDGVVALLNGEQGSPPFKTGKATEAQLQALRSLLASVEWQQLDASYGRQVPDAFMYTVTGGGVQVTTYDGAQNPPVLENVLSKLDELWQAAQSGS